MKFRAKSLVRAFGSATTVVSKPTKVYTHISAPLTSLSKNTSLMGRVFSGIGTEFSKMWQSLSMSSTVAQRTVTLTRRTLGNQQTLPLTSQGQLLLHKFDSVFSGGRLENGESEAAMLSSLSTTSSSVNQRVSPVVVDVPVVLTTTTTTNNNDDASVDLKQQENVIPAPRRSSTKKKNVAVDDKVVVMEKMAPRPPMPMPFSANDLQGIRLKKSNTSSSKRKSGVVEESQPPSQPLTSSTSSSSSVTSRPQDTNTATMNDASRVGPFTTLPRPFSMLDIQKGQKGLRKQVTPLSILSLYIPSHERHLDSLPHNNSKQHVQPTVLPVLPPWYHPHPPPPHPLPPKHPSPPSPPSPSMTLRQSRINYDRPARCHLLVDLLIPTKAIVMKSYQKNGR